MNAKLESISIKATMDLRSLIHDAEDKLLEAWNSAVEEAQANDTKPVFKIGFTINLDLDKDRMESALTFGVRHKLSVDGAIPDPGQPGLGLEDSMVTIKTGGKSVTVTGKQFADAAAKGTK
jgi:hypothetical protein